MHQEARQRGEGQGDAQLNVRVAGGDLILAVRGQDLEEMTVAKVKDLLRKKLEKQKVDIHLAAEGRTLNNPELVSEVLSGRVLEVLMVLSACPALDPEKRPLEQMDTLRDMVMSDAPEVQFEATRLLRRLLSSERDPPIQQVTDHGILGRLVEFCSPGGVAAERALQLEAAWALTNVVCGSAEHTQAAVDKGAIEAFVWLLRSGDPEVQEQAVWGLGNTAGDSTVLRDRVHQGGAMAPMLDFLAASEGLSRVRNGAWALSNLCRGKPGPPLDWVRPAVPVLATLIGHTDDEVLTDAASSLSFIADGGPDAIDLVLDAGVVRRLVELLQHPSGGVQKLALLATGTLVAGDERQRQAVLDAGILQAYRLLLAHDKRSIRRDTCRSVSNILAGGQQQIQQVLDHATLMPTMMRMPTDDAEIFKEIVRAIINTCDGGSPAHIQYLVEHEAIHALLSSVADPQAAHRETAVTAIEKIVSCGRKLRQARGVGCNEFLAKLQADDHYIAFMEMSQDVTPNVESVRHLIHEESKLAAEARAVKQRTT